MKIFNSAKILLYKQALDVHTKEHEAIAKNVANAHNTNYKRVKTDFSDELKVALNQTLKQSDVRHMDSKGSSGVSEGAEEEGVDLNEEMANLAVNQIRFDFVSNMLKKAYRGLNTSITGRTS
ncbi:MAG: flagellar basal body rod protein FlgB [Calditrichaeota bacterium]|nr:MAG: flagellar basal body rod protein FlgB [Calditrichota bacterium]MBL1203998.1 flagellar basal body rod protein FlgB [Calditrichota bacterium]NOG43829.1 flagellar basal body rod protein FlgB [Calditrichota bacterium]